MRGRAPNDYDNQIQLLATVLKVWRAVAEVDYGNVFGK